MSWFQHQTFKCCVSILWYLKSPVYHYYFINILIFTFFCLDTCCGRLYSFHTNEIYLNKTYSLIHLLTYLLTYLLTHSLTYFLYDWKTRKLQKSSFHQTQWRKSPHCMSTRTYCEGEPNRNHWNKCETWHYCHNSEAVSNL